MTSFERIQEYALVCTEGARQTAADARLPVGWPSRGAIEFDGCALRYRDDLPLVLRAVSFQVQAGTSLGICGRTGAGKSSIMVGGVGPCCWQRPDLTGCMCSHKRLTPTVLRRGSGDFSWSMI
jgi:ABC-type protease/lipase transport system fused ATPase/permease subunit